MSGCHPKETLKFIGCTNPQCLSLCCNQLNKKIENFYDGLLQDFEKRIKSIEQDNDLIKSHLKFTLEKNKEMREIIDNFVSNLSQKNDVIELSHKKPHKCPVCEGHGFSKSIRCANNNFEIDGIKVEKDEKFFFTEECPGCEGKGFVVC